MDLRSYYRRIHETEESLDGEAIVIESMATPSGGKAGHFTEVARSTAARMIVDGLAKAASDQDAAAFRQGAAEATKTEQERRQAAQVQFTVISESDLRAIARSGRTRKE